jgi:hypothetical protein
VGINHFERKVQPDLKVVLCGQLVLIPLTELERWVQRNARHLVEVPSGQRRLRDAGYAVSRSERSSSPGCGRSFLRSG